MAFERQVETRNEYLDGEVFAMTGASRNHNLIAGNLFGEIRSQLKGRRCEVYQESMRVRTPAGLFTYPDVVAVCGEPRFDDSHLDTLLNPILVVEVLSASTAAYDRGAKAAQYRSIPSPWSTCWSPRIRSASSAGHGRVTTSGNGRGSTDWISFSISPRSAAACWSPTSTSGSSSSLCRPGTGGPRC